MDRFKRHITVATMCLSLLCFTSCGNYFGQSYILKAKKEIDMFILMSRNCQFQDMYDRLDNEARMHVPRDEFISFMLKMYAVYGKDISIDNDGTIYAIKCITGNNRDRFKILVVFLAAKKQKSSFVVNFEFRRKKWIFDELRITRISFLNTDIEKVKKEVLPTLTKV